MKINIFKVIITFLISLLLSYSLYNIQDNVNKILLSYGSFILFISSLFVAICIDFDDKRKTTNLKILGGLFFSVFLLSNVFFGIINFKTSTYITLNGILLLLFLLVTYNLSKAKLSWKIIDNNFQKNKHNNRSFLKKQKNLSNFKIIDLSLHPKFRTHLKKAL